MSLLVSRLDRTGFRDLNIGVKSLAPCREFKNPGDCSGLPEVNVHRPVEPRAKPLPGVKHLRCPTGLNPDLVRPTLGFDQPMFPRLAWVLGRLSLLIAVVFAVSLWVSTVGSVWWPQSLPVRWCHKVTDFSMLGFLAVLVLTLVAQGSSNWQDRPSGFSMLVLFGGGLFLFLVSVEVVLALALLEFFRDWLGW